MSTERTACNQFNQHAWKKDICTNCSKPLSCHNNTGTFQSSSLKANINPTGNAANVSNEGCAGDATKSVSHSIKPSKPKKPSLVQSGTPKCLTTNKDISATKGNNDGKTNSGQGLKANCSFDKSKDNSNYYQIYDVTAKGQSGKPLDLDSQDDDSSYERDIESSNACLMATPYTVVDVITMALEKSRQSGQSGQTCSNPPCLPSTPAPDLRKNLSTKSDSANIKKEESRHPLEDGIKDNNSEDLDSSCHFRPRLYEEIDDSFLERVASKKLEISNSEENSCQLLNEENKTIIAKSVELTVNKLLDLNHKTVVKQEKSKKSGSKSFFQKLLGKGNKEEESCKIKVEKNGKKESSVDGKSLASSEEDARKSSESLLVEVQFKKEVEVEGGAFESSSVPEMLSQSSCIGDDFAKEIEEKFETLSRKSNLSKSTAMMRSISNKVENPFESDVKHQLTSPMLENISSLNEGISTLPHRKSVFKQSTKKADSLNNRKSMTPAEAKLARKMLVAPPPPPICTSSTSLASSSSHSASKDDISSCPNKPPPTCFISLQRKSDFTNVLAASQSPGEDVFESSEIMNRDSLMDDLDEILKKGGMTQGAASTLPKSFLHSQEKTTGKPKLTPGHISSKEITVPSNSAVQQRALPDLPQLPPPTTRLHKTNLSPEGDNVYEILPHSEDLSSPKKLNFFSSKSEKTLSRSPVKFDEIINASQSFKSDSDQVSNRPRPAPRAAIRAVGVTKVKDNDTLLESHEESYENANEYKVFNEPRNSAEGLRLDETFEEKCSIISSAAVKSLQIYLEKFCIPILSTNFFSKIAWREREVEVVRAAECKSSVLSWMKAVFYEITTGDMNCILMVRRSSVITAPLPKYNHLNLMNSLHSFEAQAELPDCVRFFQTTNEQGRNAGKAKYIFDILPYSKILAFPLLSQHVANSSSNESLCNDISKYKVHIMLQIFDSLLQLQRLGIDLYRLYPSDILLVAPIRSPKSSRHAEKERCLLPILVPTEYDEHSPRNDQKILCHDLAKIADLVMSSTKAHKDIQLGIKQPEDEKVLTCQMRTHLPQPRTRHTSIFLDKNDRCLRKVERIMATSDSWPQVEIAKNYLELSLWGPTSEEEVRLALTSPQRRQIFDMWLGIARSEILVTLMENTLAYNIPLASSTGTNDSANSNPNDVVNKNCSHELPGELTLASWFAAMETLRKAEFLAKCDSEMLLVSAKELFF